MVGEEGEEREEGGEEGDEEERREGRVRRERRECPRGWEEGPGMAGLRVDHMMGYMRHGARSALADQTQRRRRPAATCRGLARLGPQWRHGEAWEGPHRSTRRGPSLCQRGVRARACERV